MAVLMSCSPESLGLRADGSAQVATLRPFPGRHLAAVPYAGRPVPSTAGWVLDAYLPRSGTSPTRTAAALPVVVLLHGCCGDRSDLAKLAEAIATAGAVVLDVDWPGIDRDASYPRAYEAAECAVRFAHARAGALGGDANRIVLVGWSDGAMVAATLAAAGRHFGIDTCPHPWAPEQPRAVVGINGFYGWTLPVPREYVTPRAQAFFGGTPTAVPDAWAAASPYAWLGSAPSGGTLLLVGSTDPLLADARRYEAALRRAGRPVVLLELPPAGDQTLISPRSPEGRRVVAEIVGLGRRGGTAPLAR